MVTRYPNLRRTLDFSLFLIPRSFIILLVSFNLPVLLRTIQSSVLVKFLSLASYRNSTPVSLKLGMYWIMYLGI